MHVDTHKMYTYYIICSRGDVGVHGITLIRHGRAR